MIRVAIIAAGAAVWYSTTVDLQTMKDALIGMSVISIALAVLSGSW